MEPRKLVRGVLAPGGKQRSLKKRKQIREEGAAEGLTEGEREKNLEVRVLEGSSVMGIKSCCSVGVGKDHCIRLDLVMSLWRVLQGN